jgi:hypothetical protein
VVSCWRGEEWPFLPGDGDGSPTAQGILRGTGAVVHDGSSDRKGDARLMGDLWKAGKPFLAGFRRHFLYLLPAIFVAPFELYERVIRPNFLPETWPEHLIVPASAFSWVLLITVLWTAFLTYRDLYKEKIPSHTKIRALETTITGSHLGDYQVLSPATTNVGAQPSPKEERIFTNITVEELRNFYKDRSMAEGDRLIAPHLNKWLTVTSQ